MQILNIKMENDKSKFKNEIKKQTMDNANSFSVFVVRGGMILHFNLSFCFLNFDTLFSETSLITTCFDIGLLGAMTDLGSI